MRKAVPCHDVTLPNLTSVPNGIHFSYMANIYIQSSFELKFVQTANCICAYVTDLVSEAWKALTMFTAILWPRFIDVVSRGKVYGTSTVIYPRCWKHTWNYGCFSLASCDFILEWFFYYNYYQKIITIITKTQAWVIPMKMTILIGR